ncbi:MULTISPECIES: helix-turn-helix domain-containing protein [unclassified Pseudovibrio]|uniref:helix-turn-helix domain-containing protein n=1 Tax=unclassified Pseudovibrio TaxID=2627060 RepID=UPI0007AED6D1|nr:MULTISPECIES: helix-turn-helix domain-containing protein [unclassified Pseudovibrio]KZL00506.1 MarR family protein [Pseudovibrio sp. W74]KZL07681.1 MarR family protein [Pseudovibrio sp. Ad14]
MNATLALESQADRPRISFVPAAVYADQSLMPRDRDVLGVLCSSTDRNGICYRSQVKIAELLGVARSTVYRAISRLMASGWLERNAGQRPDGGRCSYTYRVINKDMPIPEQMDLFAADIEDGHVSADCCTEGQGMPAQTGSYNNLSLKTSDVDDEAAASGSVEANSMPPVAGVLQQSEAARRFMRGVAALLTSVGLDVDELRGGANPAIGWFVRGCDLEQDVVTAVREVAGRAPGLIHSLNYFTGAVLSAHKARLEVSKIYGKYQRLGEKAARQRAQREELERESCREVIAELEAEYAR